MTRRTTLGAFLSFPALFGALSMVLVAALDPFGFDTATGPHAQNLVLRILSPWYGCPLAPATLVSPASWKTCEQKTDETTVVLISDDAIDRSDNLSFPLFYEQYGALLESILARQPAAVFLDLVFDHPRENEEARRRLVELMEDFDAGPHGSIPVFVAEIRNRRTFDDFLDVMTPVPVEFRGIAGEYPVAMEATPSACKLIEGSTSDGVRNDVLRTFVAETGMVPSSCVEGGEPLKQWSIAPLLYKIYCERQTKGCKPEVLARLKEAIREGELLVPRWAYEASEHHRTFNPNIECQAPVSPGAVGTSAALLFNAALPGVARHWPSARDRVPATPPRPDGPFWCSYTRTIFADQLVEPVREYSEAQALTDAIEGKLVLIGTHVEMAEDLILSPVHGAMPGVYLHATATEGLILHGHKNFFSPRPIIGRLGFEDLLALPFGFLAAGLLVLTHRRAERHELRRSMIRFWALRRDGFTYGLIADYVRSCLRTWGVILACIAAGLVLMLVGTLLPPFLLQWSPANWVSPVAVLGAQALVLLSGDIRNTLKSVPRISIKILSDLRESTAAGLSGLVRSVRQFFISIGREM